MNNYYAWIYSATTIVMHGVASNMADTDWITTGKRSNLSWSLFIVKYCSIKALVLVLSTRDPQKEVQTLAPLSRSFLDRMGVGVPFVGFGMSFIFYEDAEIEKKIDYIKNE